MKTTNITNFASNLRWVASIPFNALFPNDDDVQLSLTQFDIPDIEIGSVSVAYRGYEVEEPTGMIQSGEKTCTFSYLIDTDMYSYWMMYKWANMYTNQNLDTIVEAETDNPIPPISTRIPISIIIIDEFKKPVINITYYDCWIKSFGNLSMSYQDEPDVLTHSFTVAYSRFEIKRIVS